MIPPTGRLPKDSKGFRVSKRLLSYACLGSACLILFVFSAALCSAQESTEQDEVLRVDTDLLLFPIRIRDKRGQAVTSITEKDLVLKDPDRITSSLYFSQGIDRVALVFALDRSGSTREVIRQQRDAALGLFERFNERSKVAVLAFAERPGLLVPFGRDASLAREAFNLSAVGNQHTAIFDAAASAIKAFEDLPPVRSERRIVILISDGLDNASATKAKSVIDFANRNRVSFYVIHLPLFEPRDGHLAVRTPAKGFRDLAEKTGGKYFLTATAESALAPSKSINLAPTFQAIEDDLRSQYLLGFYLAETANDGRKHRFSLSLPSGYEYQVGQLRYSRTQEFFVERPRQALKTKD